MNEVLNGLIDIKAFFIGLTVAMAASAVGSFFFRIPFWIMVPLVLFSMIVNSFIAEWEDNQPGGLNNP